MAIEATVITTIRPSRNTHEVAFSPDSRWLALGTDKRTPVVEVDVAGPQQQVVVGGCDVDASVLDRLPVLGVRGRQRAVPAQDVRKGAGPGRRQVEDHEHGRWQVGGQGCGQADQCLYAARRGADDQDVTVGQWVASWTLKSWMAPTSARRPPFLRPDLG